MCPTTPRRNGGWPQCYLDMDPGELANKDVIHNEEEQSFWLLPQVRGRFSIVRMYVLVVFNFHNLYLAGFQHGNR